MKKGSYSLLQAKKITFSFVYEEWCIDLFVMGAN